MRVVAIDPGAKGGVAFMSLEDSLILHEVMDMPNLDTLKGLGQLMDKIEDWEVDKTILEVQRCRGGNSALATWNHARHYGKLETCLTLTHREAILVEPIVWMRRVKEEVGDPVVPRLEATKARTWTLAQRLFPDADIVGPRGRKKDGLADAICLGWYYLVGQG